MILKDPILHRINQHPHRAWTPLDFYDLGNRELIDKTLQRLTHCGELRRIDRGIYDKPQKNLLTQQISAPDYHAIIEAVRRRDQVRVLLDGMTSANDLGLTNAVPGQVVVLTDGRLRTIVLNNLVIKFKLTAPSKLYWADRPGMRIVQSLYWLSDSIKVSAKSQQEILQKLVAYLIRSEKKEEICDDLCQGLMTLPVWMQSLVKQLLASVDKKTRT